MRFHSCMLLGLFAAAGAVGCAKKGSGNGSRATRPETASQGTIQDDGNKNQKPETPNDPNKPPAEKPPVVVMDPEAKAILADCFKVPVAEVADVVGWTDPVKSKDEANALCAKLASAKYDGTGPVATADAVDVK